MLYPLLKDISCNAVCDVSLYDASCCIHNRALYTCVLAKVVRLSLSLSLPTKISLLQSFDRPVFSSTSSLQTMIAARGGTADSFLCPHGQATHQPSGHGMTQHSSRVQKNSIHVEPIACSSPDKAKGSHPAKHEEKALFIQ